MREASLVDAVDLEWVGLIRNERGVYQPSGSLEAVATEPCLLAPLTEPTDRAGAPSEAQAWTLVLKLGTQAEAGMQGLVRYSRSGVARQRLVRVDVVQPERAVAVVRLATVTDVALHP
jgi:hypothetical protein